METVNDQVLVANAAVGDNDAISELFRRHYPAVVRYARSLSTCSTAAEDLASEAFMRTLERVRAGAQPAVFRAYIFTAVRNLFVDQLRRRREDSIDDPASCHDDLLVSPDPSVHSVELLTVRTALAALSTTHRQVLELAIVDGLTNAEIADVLGMGPNATASLTYRARRALQLVYPMPEAV